MILGFLNAFKNSFINQSVEGIRARTESHGPNHNGWHSCVVYGIPLSDPTVIAFKKVLSFVDYGIEP